MTAAGRGRLALASGLLVLAAVTLAAYWPTVGYPFVQDDWFWLEKFTFDVDSGLGFVADSFVPHAVHFWRPLGESLLLVYQRVFGLNELGFHAMHLLAGILAGLLTTGLARRLTGNALLAWTAGALVSGAVVVRLFPSLWMVGAYDLVGVVLFLLALLLFVDRHPVIAGAVYLAALLVKETTVPLIAVAAAYHLLYRSPPGTLGARVAALGRGLWPLVLALGLWLGPKLWRAPSPFACPKAIRTARS